MRCRWDDDAVAAIYSDKGIDVCGLEYAAEDPVVGELAAGEVFGHGDDDAAVCDAVFCDLLF